MATVSGTFTAVGLSAVLDVTALGEDITISLTGGATATVELQREKVPYSGAWMPIRTYVGNVEASFRQERKNERYRFEVTDYTSGTVTYSVSDGDKRVSGTILVDSEGNEIITYTQAGVDVPGTFSVTGATTFSGGAAFGTLDLASGSITDTSGAISFGDENLSTTGTLAAGVTTLDGIVGGDSALGIDGEAAAQGGSVDITGGTSSTAGNVGGVVSLTGGTPGATSAGAAVTIDGGAGGVTSGSGGALTFNSGVGSGTNEVGGAVAIAAGTSLGSGAGSASSLTGGIGGTTGAGGNATLAGGVSGSTSGTAGQAIVVGGSGGATAGTGGLVTVTSGAGTGAAGGLSGTVVMASGTTATVTTETGSASGAVTVQTGAGATATTGTAGASGAIVVESQAGGTASGAAGVGGVSGTLTVQTGTGGDATDGSAGAGAASGALTISTGTGGRADGDSASAASGAVILETGTGGLNAKTAGEGGADSIVAGASGTLTIRTGAGGALTAGASTAGAGGDIAITGGAGGEAIEDVDDTGGAGADIAITAGAGGDGQTAGIGGSIVITPGAIGTDGGGGGAQSGSIYLRGDSTSAPLTPLLYTQGIPQGDAAGAANLVPADVFSKVYVNTPAASVTVDWPGGQLMVQAIGPDLAVGDTFDIAILNLGTTGQVITMADQGLTGTVTMVGRTTIDPGVAAEGSGGSLWRLRYFGSDNWTAYRVA